MSIYESVKESIAFIEANLHNDIGVLDVANAVSYSQFYFSREFARHTHLSIYDYIIRRKLSESYKCLIETRPKILDLAVQYGFQSHEVYTRAFKKLFRESPSEAAAYKPLAIFESIDERYLAFLQGLKVERVDSAVDECFFEADSMAELEDGSDFLVLLSKDHLLVCNGIFKGSLGLEDNKYLAFKLRNLRHKIRIHHDDVKYSFRYFINYFYNVDEMSSNYLLIKREKHYIDIMIPNKSNPF